MDAVASTVPGGRIMSSVPFCLGVLVVDDIPAESGTYVLRTRSYHDLAVKVNDLQNRLSKCDLIKLYIIGYRPDKPIPVGRFFTEVEVDLGGAQKWQSIFGRWYAGAYHRIATGMKESD